MAKTRVNTKIEFRNDSSKSRIKDVLKDKRSGKSIFRIDSDLKEEETRQNVILDDVRFNIQKDGDDYAKQFKDEFVKSANDVNILSVTITTHECPHDDPNEFYDCRDDPKAKFKETHKKVKS